MRLLIILSSFSLTGGGNALFSLRSSYLDMVPLPAPPAFIFLLAPVLLFTCTFLLLMNEKNFSESFLAVRSMNKGEVYPSNSIMRWASGRSCLMMPLKKGIMGGQTPAISFSSSSSPSSRVYGVPQAYLKGYMREWRAYQMGTSYWVSCATMIIFSSQRRCVKIETMLLMPTRLKRMLKKLSLM